MKIRSEFKFPYGHRLMLHKGKCKNIHGHTGKVVIFLEHSIDSETGMVMDFSKVKQIVSQYIDSSFDHKLILNEKDPLVKLLAQEEVGLITVPCEPTAENFANIIYRNLSPLFQFRFSIDVISRIEFYETDTNCAIAE